MLALDEALWGAIGEPSEEKFLFSSLTASEIQWSNLAKWKDMNA